MLRGNESLILITWIVKPPLVAIMVLPPHDPSGKKLRQLGCLCRCLAVKNPAARRQFAMYSPWVSGLVS